MSPSPSDDTPEQLRFEGFVLDLRTHELRRDGVLVPLAPQPVRVLEHLARRAGQLVTRDELRQAVWGDDTFVDFEHGLNFCVMQVRAALGDDARRPRFVRTSPRRGYTFVADVAASATPSPTLSTRPAMGVAAALVVASVAVGASVATGPLREPGAPAGSASNEATGRSTHSLQAYAAYVEARALMQRGNVAGVDSALELLDVALRADPGYARAWVARSDALELLRLWGARPRAEVAMEARRAARRALALDPGSAEAWAALAAVQLWHDWDPVAAGQSLTRALALDPDLAVAHHDRAWQLLALGRPDAAIAAVERARELDPLSVRTNVDVAWVYMHAGRPGRAEQHARAALRIDPGSLSARACLAHALARQGRLEEAVAEWRIWLRDSGAGAETLAALEAPPHAALEAAASWRLSRLRTRASREHVSPVHLAREAIAAGRPEEALESLSDAFRTRESDVVLVARDPAFAGLRGRREFDELAARVAELSGTAPSGG